MNHNRVASVPWSVNMSQSSFSVGGFSLQDRAEDRNMNPWTPMAANSHFPRNVKIASPITLPAPEEFIQINCRSNRWNVIPISNTTNQIPKQNKVPLVAIPTVAPSILPPTVGYKFVPNPNMGNIEEELTGQNLYKTELCRSFEETGTCRYGSKCQFAHGSAELRPILRHPKYKTEVCKTFHTIGTCPYGKRCRFIHTVPDAGNSEGLSEEIEAQLEDTQKDHPKTESIPATASVMPVTNVPSEFNGYASKSSATSAQLSKLLSSNPSDWSTSWKGSENVVTSKPKKDVHQKCPKSELLQLQRTIQVNDIPKFTPTVVVPVGLPTPAPTVVPAIPASQRLSSKESAERRLAIFQQICAEKQFN